MRPGARPDRSPVIASANDLLRKFVLYAAIGAAAFAADYSVFLVLFLANDNPYIANVAGICVGMTVSFSFNRTFNFRKPDAPARRAVQGDCHAAGVFHAVPDERSMDLPVGAGPG
jgi:hypothetical protein